MVRSIGWNTTNAQLVGDMVWPKPFGRCLRHRDAVLRNVRQKTSLDATASSRIVHNTAEPLMPEL